MKKKISCYCELLNHKDKLLQQSLLGRRSDFHLLWTIRFASLGPGCCPNRTTGPNKAFVYAKIRPQ